MSAPVLELVELDLADLDSIFCASRLVGAIALRSGTAARRARAHAERFLCTHHKEGWCARWADRMTRCRKCKQLTIVEWTPVKTNGSER